jgi:hypothetical protein
VDLICKMQDILDTGSTTHIESSSKESIQHSDDESFQDLEDNTNYSKAKRELRELEKYKLKKYQPTFVKPVGGGLKGDYKGSEKELFVGLVSACGKNLP